MTHVRVSDVVYRTSKDTGYEARDTDPKTWSKFLSIMQKSPVTIGYVVLVAENEGQARIFLDEFCGRTGHKVKAIEKAAYRHENVYVEYPIDHMSIAFLNKKCRERDVEHDDVMGVYRDLMLKDKVWAVPDFAKTLENAEAMVKDLVVTLHAIDANIKDSASGGEAIDLHEESTPSLVIRENAGRLVKPPFDYELPRLTRDDLDELFESIMLGQEEDKDAFRDLFAARQSDRDGVYDFYVDSLKRLMLTIADHKAQLEKAENEQKGEVGNEFETRFMHDSWASRDERALYSRCLTNLNQSRRVFEERVAVLWFALKSTEMLAAGLTVWLGALFRFVNDSRNAAFIMETASKTFDKLSEEDKERNAELWREIEEQNRRLAEIVLARETLEREAKEKRRRDKEAADEADRARISEGQRQRDAEFAEKNKAARRQAELRIEEMKRKAREQEERDIQLAVLAEEKRLADLLEKSRRYNELAVKPGEEEEEIIVQSEEDRKLQEEKRRQVEEKREQARKKRELDEANANIAAEEKRKRELDEANAKIAAEEKPIPEGEERATPLYDLEKEERMRKIRAQLDEESRLKKQREADIEDAKRRQQQQRAEQSEAKKRLEEQKAKAKEEERRLQETRDLVARTERENEELRRKIEAERKEGTSEGQVGHVQRRVLAAGVVRAGDDDDVVDM